MIELNILKKMRTKDCFTHAGGRTSGYVHSVKMYLKEHKTQAYTLRELYQCVIMVKVEVGKSAPLTPLGFRNIVRRAWLYDSSIHRKGIYYFYAEDYTEDLKDKEIGIDGIKHKC